MVEFITKFIVVYIVIFSFYMIYFFFKGRSKKHKDDVIVEMLYLYKVYGIDCKLLGLEQVKRHIALLNSFIITLDILLYFYIEIIYLRYIVMFLTTLILIYIFYKLLANFYRKFL